MTIMVAAIRSEEELTEWVRENAVDLSVVELWLEAFRLIKEWYVQHHLDQQMQVSTQEGVIQLTRDGVAQQMLCRSFTFSIDDVGTTCFFMYNKAGKIFNMVSRPSDEVPYYEKHTPSSLN